MRVWRVVVLCAALLGVNGLRISRIEAPGDAVEGDTVTLRCEYDLDGGKLYSVKWYHNNVQFYLYRPEDGNWAFPEKDMTIDLEASNDKQLTLKNVSKSLSGKYKFEISLDAPEFSTETASVLLNISKGSTIKNLKIVLPQNVRVGDQRALLQCTYELDNVHLDKVIWFKDSAEFYTFQPGHPPIKQSKPLPGIRVDLEASNGQQAVLNNINVDTAGNYRCQVITDTQPPQSLAVDSELTVLKPRGSAIKNLKMALPQNVQVGDQTAMLQCTYELDNVHLDKVIWFKDSAEFFTFQPGHPPIKQSKPLPGIRVDVAESNGTQVILNNINVDTAGNYKCQVIIDTQPPESLAVDGELTILNPRPRTWHSPKILLPDNVHVGNKSIKLQCDYDLQEIKLYSLKWYKNGNEFYRFTPSETPQKQVFPLQGINVDITASDDKYLTLTDITKDTAGLYQCEVSSDAPLFLNLDAKAELNVLDAVEDKNIFNKAWDWLRDKWNNIKPK